MKNEISTIYVILTPIGGLYMNTETNTGFCYTNKEVALKRLEILNHPANLRRYYGKYRLVPLEVLHFW